MCEMKAVKSRSITLLALCSLAALVSAQVTFSRDWSGGKRSSAAIFDCGQFARLCRHFLHDLKESMSAVKMSKQRTDKLEDLQPVYEDEK